jgi:formylglycine-generating enzyme required for sulfatase activity
MGSMTNIRILGWGIVAAIILHYMAALRFASPEPMKYIIISGMLVAYLPFLIFPFRTAFAGKSFSRCAVVGWQAFFISQFLHFFIDIQQTMIFVELRGEDFNAGGAIMVAAIMGWLPGSLVAGVAIACKKIVDRFFLNDRGVLQKVPLVVLAGVLCGVGILVFVKAQENKPAEILPFDLQSIKVMTNSIGMKLVWIPPGEFPMGSSNEYHEQVHKVNLSRGFWMGQFEVTQDQYLSVMGANPSEYKGDTRPVERVSWYDAVEFCRKLGFKEGKSYRLPTEAEWEYGCRAGTMTKFSFGDSVGRLWQYGNYCDASNTSEYRTYERDKRHNDQYDKTSPVGSFAPNPWGLYDMHGNVWEWCSDWRQDDYGSETVADPTGPEKGKLRVLRGGCWNSGIDDCRSSARNRSDGPDNKSDTVGFRVVLESE